MREQAKQVKALCGRVYTCLPFGAERARKRATSATAVMQNPAPTLPRRPCRSPGADGTHPRTILLPPRTKMVTARELGVPSMSSMRSRVVPKLISLTLFASPSLLALSSYGRKRDGGQGEGWRGVCGREKGEEACSWNNIGSTPAADACGRGHRCDGRGQQTPTPHLHSLRRAQRAGEGSTPA